MKVKIEVKANFHPLAFR